MKSILVVVLLLSGVTSTSGQTPAQGLATAFQRFERDQQMKAGIASLYVVNAKTGAVIFNKNGNIGLAPASTQKIITAASAYEMLAKDFRYITDFSIGEDDGKKILYIKPSGDPTLGSTRWEQTSSKSFLNRISKKISATTIDNIVVLDEDWNHESIPEGWIWQDVGNYYGAGASALNWRENKFEVVLRSGTNIGEPVKVISTEPRLQSYAIHSEATSAAKGSGDNAYIYFDLGSTGAVVRGTIPVNENRFIISGATPSAKQQFIASLAEALKIDLKNSLVENTRSLKITELVHREHSPPLDSIIYWLNKKSINLFGEALLKTIAHKKSKVASTAKGVQAIKEFWKSNGIDPVELNIADGSGLSPLNRVTTRAQVLVLQYAKKQPWFAAFYNSLPEYNGMKMKSGTINDVKAYSGYHRARNGEEYIFSFVVNNYNGSSATLVQKMYQVLDLLK
ncbi:MAG TPA: D-alanyl-D-alanine carboxypeptidase/D-alanyl-D-alanine-endopeptidase [Chitinophagaceae bacterium]|nr:D-alanyl-D-alanine carboxypeptidase/D-alanyl-D-alanine-endopeptidase [Chitinophagaceae bacterium]